MSEKHSTAGLIAGIIFGWGYISLTILTLPPIPYSLVNWIYVGIETFITYGSTAMYFAWQSGRLPQWHFSLPESWSKFFGTWGVIILYAFDAVGMSYFGYSTFVFTAFPTEARPWGYLPISDLISISLILVGLWCAWRTGQFVGAELRERRVKRRAEVWLSSL